MLTKVSQSSAKATLFADGSGADVDAAASESTKDHHKPLSSRRRGTLEQFRWAIYWLTPEASVNPAVWSVGIVPEEGGAAKVEFFAFRAFE